MLPMTIVENCSLSTGALSRLILSDDSLRIAVNELRTSKVGSFISYTLYVKSNNCFAGGGHFFTCCN